MVDHQGVEPCYGAYKAPALTDELMVHLLRVLIYHIAKRDKTKMA